jgi:hypothetical protein
MPFPNPLGEGSSSEKRASALEEVLKCCSSEWGHYRINREMYRRVTPAMAAELTDHVWSIREVIALLA